MLCVTSITCFTVPADLACRTKWNILHPPLVLTLGRQICILRILVNLATLFPSVLCVFCIFRSHIMSQTIRRVYIRSCCFARNSHVSVRNVCHHCAQQMTPAQYRLPFLSLVMHWQFTEALYPLAKPAIHSVVIQLHSHICIWTTAEHQLELAVHAVEALLCRQC